MTKPIQLHIGAGMVRLPEFTNVDVRALPGIDYVTSADKLDMFEDNSVDLIYASHILEHFWRNEMQKVLKEWYRVLKSGGTLRLSVPSFEACIKVYQMTKNLGLLLGHLVGRQDSPENIHYMIFDFVYLTALLGQAGFRNIRKYDWRKTIHKDYDDYSQGYFPHLEKDTGILMSLNVEAEK